MENNKLTNNEFQKIVNEQYGFLEKDFDFSLQQNGDWKYIAENPYCRIHIFLEHMYPVVDIEAIGEGAKQLRVQNILPSRVGVGVIAEILDPDKEIGSSYKTIDELLTTDVRAELTKQASLLRTWCEPMFRGDFSKWPEIEAGTILRRKAFFERFQKK